MKRTTIAILTLVAATLAVSCEKENTSENNEINPNKEGMTICAVSEGIGVPSKAEMVYKYDVVWNKGDKIIVKNSEKSVEFVLSGGEGTTKGIFSSPSSISGDVEGFYPSGIVTDGGLVWPAEQQGGQICPMYSKKNLSLTKDQTFSFTSLGSVLQIVFNTTQENVTLKSIEIKDSIATLSGVFTVDKDGKAVIAATDKAGITLDLGESGVTLGKGANFFNIALPAGNYQKLALTFTATDGTKCVFNGGKINVEHNTVGKLVLTGLHFLPEGALPGIFTVSDDGEGNVKKVYFSQGNLYYDGTNWGFESEQYYFRTYNGKGKYDKDGYSKNSGTAEGHWGLFGWSTENDNFGMNTSTNNGDYSGNFVDWGTVIDNEGTWTTLSGGPDGEWKYLLDNHITKWGTCNGVHGLFIAPDDFVGDKTALSTAVNDWKSAQKSGIVFLPAAGDRGGTDIYYPDSYGLYWSSSALDAIRAFGMIFNNSEVATDDYDARSIGYCVRLVTEIK